MPNNELTAKQKLFCYEYVLDHNGARAYRTAYPNSSEKAAESNSSRLIRVDKVSSYIEKLENKKLKTLDCGIDDVLNELKNVAFANGTDFARIIDGEVVLIDTEQLSQNKRSAIAQIKKSPSGTEVKTYDKVKALTELLKHFELAQSTDDGNKEIHLIVEGDAEKWSK